MMHERRKIPVVWDDEEIQARRVAKMEVAKKRGPKKPDLSKCKYAQDTGEVAFPAAPCRGNKIICQHPKNDGFVSFTKQCRKGKCVFFDAET